jgi:glycosyltransferase involved in cell wall biosynthesis
MLEASVVICTRDPRPDYLARVLEALGDQTLSADKWELLIIDNASNVPVASSCDVSSHPRARHITESEIGVAAARRRGMREAAADLIVFVDDDNVLDKTYLSEAVKIKQEWPLLGAWGSGCIKADYEVEPPEYLETYLPMLALRDLAGPRWSNFVSIPDAIDTIPWGAGLCVRKEVARAYCRFYERSSIRITGRQGGALMSGEDKELSYVACAGGFGIGTFPLLKIKHLIPQHRISEEYLVRLSEGIALSDLLIDYKWLGKRVRFPNRLGVLLRFLETILLHRGLDRRFRLAKVRALASAQRIIEAAPS